MFFQRVFTSVANGAVFYVPPSGGKIFAVESRISSCWLQSAFLEFKVEILVN